MPRSSRSKSHKQSKHSSKEAAVKEYSDFDEDVKVKERSNNEDLVSVRVSKDGLVSGEKRKISKDMSNGDASEEHTKRRKEKSHGGSDRWDGGGGEEKVEVVNVDSKELVKSRDVSKSKSSKRHDAGSTSVVAVEKDESKGVGGSRGEKRKSEKESGRKEGHLYEESKEVRDKDRKVKDGKREADALLKQTEHQHSKGKENSERLIEEDLRNPELEKELEKRIRRRGEGSSDKNKYEDDVKEGDNRMISTRSGRAKDVKHKEGDRETRHKDDKHREDGERVNKSRDVKYRGENERDNKHRDDKYREDSERERHREGKYREDGNRDRKCKDDKYHEDGRRRDEKYRDAGDKDKRSRDDDRDYRHKEEKHREDVDRDYRHRDGRPRDDTDRERRVKDSKYKDVHISRDHPGDSETKSLRDDGNAAETYHRKTHRDGSPSYDERVVAKYKEEKDRRRDTDKDEPADYRSRSNKDHYSESEKRSLGSAKLETVSEKGRLNSRDVDMENTANHSRRRSSPSGKFYPSRDHYRVSKLEETKYKDYVYEERARHSVNSSRDFTSASGKSDKVSSRSLEQIPEKDDNYIADLSAERRLRSDAHSSLVDKSPSSTSNERKHLNRPDARRSFDVDERTGGSKAAKEYSDNDGKALVDGDNLSVSSPYSRSGHFSGNNSKSLLPPPSFRTGPDSPSGFGHPEDDNRGKSNNRQRRMGDPNMGRAQSNWNWPSPLGNGGYLPFQQVPPPMFHPVMQQFPPPMFGRPPVNVPYHVPDSGQGRPMAWRNQMDESIPPPIHGWEANNAMFGDESHMYGRLDWESGRTQLNNLGWDSGAGLWKGQHSGSGVEMQSAPQKDDEIWSGQNTENEQNQLDFQAESMNISQKSGNSSERNTPDALKVTEGPHIVKDDDHTLKSHVYLSKIDVSEHLTQPELYDQCTSMLDLDQEVVSDEFDCKILFLEENSEADITDSASLFPAVDNSVFEKAVSLYKKHKEDFGAMNKEIVLCSINQVKGGSDDDNNPMVEAIEGRNDFSTQKLDLNPVKNVIVIDESEKSQEEILTSDKMDMEEGVEEKSCTLEEVSKSDQQVKDVKCGDGSLLLDSDTTECGSVNLSRIHDASPESTH